MSAAAAGIDASWLNDRTDYQLNFVHGLRNPSGLHLQYSLDDATVTTTWTPTDAHAGFPGLVHGGLIAAVLDDVMGRCSVLQRRWVVTGRMETRFRQGAAVGEPLTIRGWSTRFSDRVMQAEATMSMPDGAVVAEATGTYLPIPRDMVLRMVEAWPGFADFIDVD
jgi:acyl-coenzyme A thioesterase PaaI-like protein